MNKKIAGALLTAVFTMSTLSMNAYAGGDHKKMDKNKKTTQSQMMKEKMPSRMSTQNPDVNPYLDPANPDSGIVLSMDNYGVTAVTGSTLRDELNYNKSLLKKDDMQKQEMIQQDKDMNQNQLDSAVQTDPAVSDEMKDAVQESNDPNAVTSYDPAVQQQEASNTATTSTMGASTVNGTDLNSIDILNKYNSNVSDCINDLSTLNGVVVKNDAFFACQKYKIN